LSIYIEEIETEERKIFSFSWRTIEVDLKSASLLIKPMCFSVA
jgi:hypothetical protein